MRRIYEQFIRLEAILAGTLLMLMVALIFTGGIARMMRNPLNWTIDLSTCFFAWACFLCADIAWRNDRLMSIDVIGDRLPLKLRFWLTYINYTIISAFLVYMIYAGLWLSWVSRARSFQGIPAISYSWVTMSISVGGLLLLITTIIKLTQIGRDGQSVRATD